MSNLRNKSTNGRTANNSTEGLTTFLLFAAVCLALYALILFLEDHVNLGTIATKAATGLSFFPFLKRPETSEDAEQFTPHRKPLKAALNRSSLQGQVDYAYEIYREKPFVEKYRPLYLMLTRGKGLLHLLSVVFALSFGTAIFYNLIAGTPLSEAGINWNDWKLYVSSAIGLVILAFLEIIKERMIKDTSRALFREKRLPIGFALVGAILISLSIYSSFEGSQETSETVTAVDAGQLRNDSLAGSQYNSQIDFYQREIEALQKGERGFKFGWWTGGKVGKGSFALNDRGKKERDRLFASMEADKGRNETNRLTAQAHNLGLKTKAASRLAFIGGILGYLSIGVELFILIVCSWIQYYLFVVYTESINGLSKSPTLASEPATESEPGIGYRTAAQAKSGYYAGTNAGFKSSNPIGFKQGQEAPTLPPIEPNELTELMARLALLESRIGEGSQLPANLGKSEKVRTVTNFKEDERFVNNMGQNNSGKRYQTKARMRAAKKLKEMLSDNGRLPSANALAKASKVSWQVAKDTIKNRKA